MIRLLICSFLLISLAGTVSFGQTNFKWIVDGSPVTIQEKMKNEQTPGISICVMIDGQIDTMFHWGHADQESRRPVTPEIGFQMGSMGISLAHFLILKWENEGRFELDDPVNNYLRTWTIPDNKYTDHEPVSIRDLLLHRRGFKSVAKPKGYLPKQPLPTTQQMLIGAKPANNPAVVVKKNLNVSGNGSYYNALILQCLIEDLGGASFEEVITKEVLIPLELHQSFACKQFPTKAKDNTATGYDKKGSQIPGRRWIYPEIICGGIWMAPKDYARYVQHIFDAAEGKDNRFISAEQAAEGINPPSGYRATLLLKQKNHYWGGATMGFRTQFTGNTNDRWIVVICMNSWENWSFMAEVNSQVLKYVQQKINQ